MRIDYLPRALRRLDGLPPNVRKAFFKQVRFLAEDLHHPSLHAKKYDEAQDLWQARVTKLGASIFHIIEDTYLIRDIISHPKLFFLFKSNRFGLGQATARCISDCAWAEEHTKGAGSIRELVSNLIAGRLRHRQPGPTGSSPRNPGRSEKDTRRESAMPTLPGHGSRHRG